MNIVLDETTELEEKILLLVRKASYLLKRAASLVKIFEDNKKVLPKYSYPNNPKMKLIAFHHNLYVNEVAIILGTILSEDKNEISLKNLYGKYKNNLEFEKIAFDIKNKYKNSNSKDIRNKISAHKQNNFVDLCTIITTNLYTTEVKRELDMWFNDIEQICLKSFREPVCNNEFDDYYRDSDAELDNFLLVV